MNKVVKLSADWCKHCTTFAPIFDRAATKTTVPFETWDVDEIDRTWLHNLGVKSIPTVLFYREGEVVRVSNSKDEREILDLVGDIYGN